MVVDDHPVVRMGLTQLINDQDDMKVCCETGAVGDALTLTRSASPDVALVDISLGESSGIDLVRALHAAHPDLPVLVLSMHDERLFAERALRAGARGYIMKQEAGRDLLTAIRRVAGGTLYLSVEMTDRMLAAAAGHPRPPDGRSPLERLTDREREVFTLIGDGRGTQQIADGLRLSVKTVASHRARIKEKLGLKTATELVRFAATWTAGV